ncbi:MAG: LacI family transcriptional regulator [Lentisphaerae bacterium]|nr:LacI family transcriptional regulator [Lentisphaerota bacterium]
MEKTVIMKKTTIRELAKICGTAPSTVSRALNNSGSVDEDTRQKIVRAAEKYHYRKLKNSAKRWVFIADNNDLKSYYESELMISLSKEIINAGDTYVIISSLQIDMIHEFFFDGVFVFSQLNMELLKKINPLPVIAFNNYSLHKNRLWSVSSDDEGMIKEAVNYFYSKGHRNIGLWIWPDTHNFSDIRREKFFRQAITGLGLKPLVYIWGAGELEASEFSQMVRDGVTAMLLPGEFNFRQLQLMLKTTKFSVPGKYSLIMLENRRFTPFTEPPLTTFEQDLAGMSRHALHLAHQIAGGATGMLRNIKVPYLFHERASVADIRKSPVLS